ncbi:MAG: DNA adenine methylase [Myxococcota bacterium]
MSLVAVKATEAGYSRPKPFLKWAGGKTQLLPEILARFPTRFGRYFEPFVGGGAVFFALGPRRAVLTDINENLINTYKMIRDDLDGVIAALDKHRATEEHFYRVRAQNPAALSPLQAAARTIYLNRTCFNGLYRVNAKGQFNVPYGRYERPNICNVANLQAVCLALRGVDLRVSDVVKATTGAKRGDLIYFDPPYDPVSPTASFTSYTAGRFGREDQARLARRFGELAAKGVHVVLSNADTPLICDLYKDFRIERVRARRAINSRADRRGPVSEVIITAP